jgi:hypothetical protein
LHFICKQEVISFNIDRARRLTTAILLERRFSVGYRNARAKAENSSNSGEAYHFESLARQYAWDLFTLQRQGVIAAVQQANHCIQKKGIVSLESLLAALLWLSCRFV